MSVNFLWVPPTYNKAPLPDKAPDEKLYPIKLMIGDQPVWVSLPQPDKLHLSVELRPEHFAKAFKPEHPHDYGRMIMQALATGQAGPVEHAKYVPHDYIYTQLQAKFGEAQQPVFFTIARTKGKPEGAHTLGIQLNPRLLTEEGFYELLDRLHKVTQKQLLVGAMLCDARVCRLDIAVDIVGIDVCDLLVRIAKEGKRALKTGLTGSLEAIEIWAKGTKKAIAGQRAVIVYDKRQERVEAGGEPPFGCAPMTRVEVTKKRFGNKTLLLTSLGDLSNQLASVTAGSVSAAGHPTSRAFVRYVDARRAVGPDRAAWNLLLATKTALQFENWYLNHGSDILNGAKIWEGWTAGLSRTGVALLIEAAKKKSTAVPLPDIDWG